MYLDHEAAVVMSRRSKLLASTATQAVDTHPAPDSQALRGPVPTELPAPSRPGEVKEWDVPALVPADRHHQHDRARR